jgi:hypothetical protein
MFRELGRYVKLDYFCHRFSPSSRLFLPHRKLDSLIVAWDATELSFDCQTNVLQMSGT